MPETYEIAYHFRFADGREKTYTLAFDARTADLVARRGEPPPDWARLTHRQCAGCPLSEERSPYCPVAANLAHLVEHFKDVLSHTPATVVVRTGERDYAKETTVQKGLASLFGLVMATSGCPVLDPFKPMARFHLPFATNRETSLRSLSAYLVRQYFAAAAGGRPDLDLSGLRAHAERVQEVNQGMAGRLSSVRNRSAEADENAVAILDIFCLMLATDIENRFAELSPLFGKPE